MDESRINFKLFRWAVGCGNNTQDVKIGVIG